jgi:hypothetical protein
MQESEMRILVRNPFSPVNHFGRASVVPGATSKKQGRKQISGQTEIRKVGQMLLCSATLRISV